MSMMNYRSVPVTAACMILIPLFSEAVYEGCRSLEPELIDVYRMNGGFGFEVAVHVYLPLISGYLRQAFVNAAGMGLKVAVSAEYLVQTKDSLGKAVYSSAYFSEYAEIYAYALIMVFLVLLLTEVPERFFRRRAAA
jgi:ABC-type nitrate/sulfonate/bicarbonate transport system permease component